MMVLDTLPDSSDLRKLIRFSEKDGAIWLAENRMVLLHTAALGSLRRELIATVGKEQARRILTRMGYASGVRDAELAKRVRAGSSLLDTFVTGPQLHALEGIVSVTPVRIEMDVESGKFYGEFLWKNSWEDEAHVKELGPSEEPVCWTQIGYASGYTSAFMGRFVLFKEVECAACGHNFCRIIGKPVDEWDDSAEFTPYFESDSIVERMLELRSQVDYLRATLVQQTQVPHLVGVSQGFRRAYDLISRAATTQVTVLLLGETGVGKERFARALHQSSPRKHGPFVAVNCAALPHDLVESELFGVEKGAFTGAVASRMGKFERADGGTLFLDEIGELPLAAQAKLLRVIQEGEIERLGDDRTRKVNVRLVAATNVDLQVAVREGRFRRDLYYRLNVYPIQIPPLRERVADIPPLIDAMFERFCAVHEKKLQGVSDKTLQALKRYHWPGNVRELENMIERGVILAPQGGWIEEEHLFPHLVTEASTWESGIAPGGGLEERSGQDHTEGLCEDFFSARLSLDELEARLISEAVSRSAGNLAGAARLLGITRPQLQYRLKRNTDSAPAAPPR